MFRTYYGESWPQGCQDWHTIDKAWILEEITFLGIEEQYMFPIEMGNVKGSLTRNLYALELGRRRM